MHGTILTDATLANARFSGADLRGAIVDARTAEAPELGISNLPRRDAGLVESLPEKLAEHRTRSEEHTSELQSLMRISYAVFCLKKKKHIYVPNLNITDHSEQAKIRH